MGGWTDPTVPGLDAGAEKCLLLHVLFSKNSPCFGEDSAISHIEQLGTECWPCGPAGSTGIGSTVRWACSWGQIQSGDASDSQEHHAAISRRTFSPT